MEAKRKAISEMATDTRILCNVLESHLIKEGKDFVSYDDLNAAINGDVQLEARGRLATARKYIEREHGTLLECIMGQGLKRSSDRCGTLDTATKSIKRKARRAVRRVVNTLGKVDESDTSTLTAVNTRVSLLGAIVMFASNKAQKKLTEKVQANQAKELPVGETLKVFDGK